MADIIGLDVRALNLASFDHESVTLASVSAKESSSRELEVESAGEGTTGVSKETNTAALVGIERFTPGVGHEGVVDGDDEDLASVLDLGVLDVAGDVGVGAGWAKGSRDADD